MNVVYIAFPESPECKEINKYPKVFSSEDPQLKILNKQGYGIFRSVNQMNDGTGRKESDLAQLDYVYCDFDLAKEGDDTKNIEQKKIKAIEDLSKHCQPNFIITSKNGFHPYWKLKDTDKSKTKEYVEINRGIIEYSTLLESAGDAVYDTARVLRVPNYHHCKSDPFKCELVRFHDNSFSHEELRAKFPYSPPVVKQLPNKTFGQTSTPSISVIYQAVMQEIGHTISYQKYSDKNWHVSDSNGSRGVFITEPDSPDGLVGGQSATLPYFGNGTTVVSKALGISNNDAWKWVCQKFSIPFDPPSQTAPAPVPQPPSEGIKLMSLSEIEKPEGLQRYSTGFLDIDLVAKALWEKTGGLATSEVVAIIGRPGRGKSLIAIQIIKELQLQGLTSLCFNYEGSQYSFQQKLKSVGSDNSMVKIVKLKTKETLSGSMDLIREAVQLAVKSNIKVLVLDNLAFLKTGQSKGNQSYSANQSAILTSICTEITELTVKYELITLIVAHTRKSQGDGFTAKRPTMLDVLGTSALDQLATFGLVVDRVKDKDGIMSEESTLYLDKNRPGGVSVQVPLVYKDGKLIQDYEPRDAYKGTSKGAL